MFECALCGAPVKRRREHVRPDWIFERYKDDGPFTFYKGAEPIPYRSGRTERPQLSRVLAPACDQYAEGGRDCNGWLNTHFEQPAKDHVRALLDGRPISGRAVTAVARWAVKTLLLEQHPDAYDAELPNHPRDSWPNLDYLLFFMQNTGQLPPELSLWCTVTSQEESGPVTPDEVVLLPRLHVAGRAPAVFEFSAIGYGMTGGRQLALQLLHHPYVEVEHPFEAANLATRLWPEPPTTLDPAEMPTLGIQGTRHWNRTFCKGGGMTDLNLIRMSQSASFRGLVSPRITVREPGPGGLAA
ncbi:hypothetical protein [Streptomyces himalayensis]|uniref:Uncharacterized protein n=1 Tax=Streptomyces himalayensis subsp. himalayensis TaxID=2756131 RepID=A0A7W0ICM2_9ACTN|nr:hypothetical protein [Streptomyces himalayensis]MBA2950301.1 hypothetical protein [Streptomyces himalayensis subsp. himalayensis]